MPKGADGDGAFWIKDDLDRAYRFPPYLPGPGTVLWYETSQEGNGFDDLNTLLIKLRGEAEQRPDVVVHEYGHRVMYNWYGGIMPEGRGGHAPYEVLTQSFAWKEAWGDFFALAVNGNSSYTLPGGQQIYDFEIPSWGFVDPFDFVNWNDGDAKILGHYLFHSRVGGAVRVSLHNAISGPGQRCSSD